MFLGEHTHSVDEKGRLTIPSRYRALLEGGVVVTRGLDENLVLYPLEVWNEIAARIRATSRTDAAARSLRRRFFSGAVDLRVDGQGRILIPASLREFAGMDGEIVIAGVDDHLERETSPPYPVPLRGVQVTLRLSEPGTRQVRKAALP